MFVSVSVRQHTGATFNVVAAVTLTDAQHGEESPLVMNNGPQRTDHPSSTEQSASLENILGPQPSSLSHGNQMLIPLDILMPTS